jgi:hypothetical protein
MRFKMKKFLPFALLALCTSAAFAAPDYVPYQNAESLALRSAIGQPLYDLHDMRVGVIRGTTAETGQPSVIVAIEQAEPGRHEVLITADSVQPRTAGGWLAALSAESLWRFRTYVPGHMPPG